MAAAVSFSKASNNTTAVQVCKCLKTNLETFQVLRESDPEKITAYYKVPDLKNQQFDLFIHD